MNRISRHFPEAGEGEITELSSRWEFMVTGGHRRNLQIHGTEGYGIMTTEPTGAI